MLDTQMCRLVLGALKQKNIEIIWCRYHDFAEVDAFFSEIKGKERQLNYETWKNSLKNLSKRDSWEIELEADWELLSKCNVKK